MAAITNRKEGFIHIALFGAFDLESLGDTMFPIVFHLEMAERLGNRFDIDLYAPNGAEHPYNSLPAVYPINSLIENHANQPYDALVIGGGEFIHFQSIRYTSPDHMEKRYEAGELWKKPQELADQCGIPVIWNCVGAGLDFEEGEQIRQIQKVCSTLKYISVRDEYSRIRLQQAAGIKGIRKVPDMLWMFSKHLTAEELSDCLRELKKEYLFLDKEYLVLQYGTSMEYEKLAEKVRKISLDYGLEVVLLTVNYCHEDQEAADQIYSVCREFHRVSRKLQPKEIMAVIAGAKFFLGTSLHGNITAMSYGVKNLCLDMYPSFVGKMDGLFEMLQMKELLVPDVDSLRYRFEQQMKTDNREKIVAKIVSFQQQLEEHFDQIADLLKNHTSVRYQMEEGNTSGCHFAKSVLSNGENSISYVSNGKTGSVYELVFKIKNVNGIYKGKFFYTNPFLVEKLCVFENGKPIESTLTDMLEDGSHQMLYKDECRFFLRSEEAINGMSILKIHMKLQDAKKLYMCFLEKEVESARQEVLNRQGHIELLLKSERKLQNDLKVKQNCMNHLSESERKLQQKLQELSESERKLQQELKNKQGHIELLLESERELERIKISRTWRLAFQIQQLTTAVVPSGSMRRLLLKMAVRLLRHPKQSLRLLSPRKLRHFFSFLREEGPGFVSQRIDESMRGIAVQKTEMAVREDTAGKSFEEYHTLIFPDAKEPVVSIIIPVYNHFSYTYGCLRSILEYTKEAPGYEVIIADDGSTDDTVRLGEVVKNVHVIRNTQNMRFLKNCNHAAKSARGKYLLFLNNDTQVQKDWLESLVKLMEEDENAGMAGSKLVYADGRLQEAGGIVWEDASAWNYGHSMDPYRPQFQYLKEADYISGASVMIRKELWEQIGGFDERFAPAYYEDTDLAFEVRKRGFKVMYQPLSVVVHFEGISNGTDLSEGQKAYQDRNRGRFYEKWEKILTKENFKNGTNVFLARDRSRKKKTLLVVDHYVPTYDKDAGSRCIYDYLKLFVSVGYNVKFIGDNFYKSEPYTTALQQMGIEVLYGDYYYNHWKDWIRENGQYFDYVLLSRPHISIKYIDLIRSCSRAKIIYFGHDLHYLRGMREYRLHGNRQVLKDADEWKKMELELMRKADVSYYLSQVELDEIAKLDATVRTRRVPIHIYSQMPAVSYCAADRKDILFVGGFGHPPNTDAVKWLAAEIMPLVWKDNSDIVLHVAGQNPPQEIRELSGPRVRIHGFVPDKELEAMYRSVKLAVVPLRFGAGIKGKIIESMKRGVPVVTTEIGIEGIEGAEKLVKIGKDAQELAEAVVKLYGDEKSLEKMSQEEWQYIAQNYSFRQAVEILRKDFWFSSGEQGKEEEING